MVFSLLRIREINVTIWFILHVTENNNTHFLLRVLCLTYFTTLSLLLSINGRERLPTDIWGQQNISTYNIT